MIRCIKILVRIDVELDEDKFYAYCPEIKGVHVEGRTEDEAILNARDAVMAYIESLLMHNDPLPLCAEEISLREMVKKRLVSFFTNKKHISKVEELLVPVAA
jgi:predicted RNase H-like HicB family nuclease